MVSRWAWSGGGWRRVVGWAALCLAASALAAPGGRVRVRKGDDMQAVGAETILKGGRALMAADMAEKCLAARPDAVACERVMWRAYAAAGHCARALPGTMSMRARGLWDDELAAAEAVCRLRTTDAWGALVAYDEAIHLKDKELTYTFERALVTARLGLGSELDPVIDELRDSKEPWMGDVVEAWRAVEGGDPLADYLLAVGNAVGEGEGRPFAVQMAILDCRRWLDLGDPVEADAAARRGVKLSMTQTRLLACRAEAVRRQGWAEEALELVTRPWNETATTPYLDAVEVRVLVDLGRLDEAAQRVARLPDTLDPDVTASRWYVARETDDAAAARYAARFEGSRVSPEQSGRSLSDYLPVGNAGRR